jgi:hypothetical protein
VSHAFRCVAMSTILLTLIECSAYVEESNGHATGRADGTTRAETRYTGKLSALAPGPRAFPRLGRTGQDGTTGLFRGG